MIKDLSVGKPGQVLWRFTIPMFISVVFQQFYNIADSVIAGKFAGEDALASVGASYPITMIFMAIAVGCNVGCCVVISQLFGAKELEKMKTAIYTTLISSAAVSVICTVSGLLLTTSLMKMIRTPENIFADGSLYLKIYIAGFIFLFLYNICTGIFQSLGDSKTPLYFLIGSSLGNIALDLLFVAGFGWGVAGVAWATFIAQGAACVLSFVSLTSRIRSLKTAYKPDRFSWSMLLKVGRYAVPSILQQSFVSVGNIFVQGIINNFGSSVIAGYSAAIKLNTFTITSVATFSNGLSSFTAQNIGAGKTERVREGYKAGMIMVLCVVVPFILIYFFFGDVMMKLFMDNESRLALDTGLKFLKIVSPFYIAVTFKIMADGVLRGAGAMSSFMIATFTDLLLRVVLSFILSDYFGVTGVWMSWPIGWVISMCLSLGFYFRGNWAGKLTVCDNE
ncbi:MAG: MATE family efflux transporter [Oscillospiraceae bacterium]|nr:MATE family efflux transporter [Oscillospiraceae bacterium]